MRIIVIIAIIVLIAIAVLAILLLSGFFFQPEPVQQVSGTLPDKECNVSDDCPVGDCLSGRCLSPLGIGCLSSLDCQSGYCNNGVCSLGVGSNCTNNNECVTNNCDQGKCKLTLYAKCAEDIDCSSGLVCSLGACSTQNGTSCSNNNQCQTRSCNQGVCSNFRQIFELVSSNDVLYSRTNNEGSPTFVPSGNIVPMYPEPATGLISIFRCYYPTRNVHSVAVNSSCPINTLLNLNDPIRELVLGYGRTGLETDQRYKICLTQDATTFIRLDDCNVGEIQIGSYSI